MKKSIIVIVAMIGFAGIASATETKSEKAIAHGNEHIAVVGNCFPAVGNWVNAATYSCPDRGYGPASITRDASAPAPKSENK